MTSGSSRDWSVLETAGRFRRSDIDPHPSEYKCPNGFTSKGGKD